jgi:hypothetical protein
MPGPGSGRYTSYTPSKTVATRLGSLFKAPDDTVNYIKNPVPDAIVAFTDPAGDINMFPQGVTRTYEVAPDIKGEIESYISINGEAPVENGGPANSYMPDLSSPGGTSTPDAVTTNVNPEQKETAKIAPGDYRPNYVVGAPGTGTKSPAAADAAIAAGIFPIGKDLILGKAGVKA